LSHTK